MSDTTSPTTAAKTTRISFVRVGILALATLAGVAGILAVARPVVVPVPTPGRASFAAYVDVTAVPSYPFETPQDPSQLDVTLAFIVASPTSPCTPTWGSYYDLDQAATDLELDRRIAQLRSTGGDVGVSFGGQANNELATVCTDPNELVGAYRQVVDRYELTRIDLDIEGAALADSASIDRRAKAIAAVQAQSAENGRPLAVWLTLPVATSGLTSEGVRAVDALLQAGVDVAGVNGMTMDFGASKDRSQSMSEAAISAVTALQGQVQEAFARNGDGLDPTHAWGHVGMTPMIGQNDVAGEIFTLDDAEAVNAFARSQGVGLVSMWSANRDATCARPLPAVISIVQTSCSGIDQQGVSFSSVLGKDLDVATVGTAEPTVSATPSVAATSPTVVDDPATSPFPLWEPLGTYPAGSKVVWKKHVYQAKWWTSGVDPTTPGATDGDMPWMLLGPVMPGDTPAPLPTMPANTYAQWNPETAYVAGTRVQLGNVPYEAAWWTKGQQPGKAVAGGSPWVLVYPTQ